MTGIQKMTGDESVNDILSDRSRMSVLSQGSRLNPKRFDVNTDVRKLFEDGMGVDIDK